MKKLLYPFVFLILLCVTLFGISAVKAQTENNPTGAKSGLDNQSAAANTNAGSAKGKAASATKVVKPMAFWAATPPVVAGKIETKYDINEDGILQTSEVKILLRRVIAQVMNENINFNIEDSKLLKAYDKNKDGIISKLELEEIKKDLSLQQ